MNQLEQVFSDIANSIRMKAGITDSITPSYMANTINQIVSSEDVAMEINNNTESFFKSYRNNLYQVFNCPISINNDIITTISLFNNWGNFNQSVNIPNSVTNCVYMFSNCVNLNSHINIGDNVLHTGNMFSNCVNFNQPITIPNSVTNCAHMFSKCSNFNQPITIGPNIFNCHAMLFYCNNFNSAITTYKQNSEYLLQDMSLNKTIFNAPVYIGNGVTSVASLVSVCPIFNQPVTIPDSVTNCESMFYSCYNFNQPTIIPNLITDCAGMFRNCYNFDQPITVPSLVTNCSNMFANCTSLQSDIRIICAGSTDANSMFENCNNISNIYWLSPDIDRSKSRGFFGTRYYNDPKQVNIYCNTQKAYNNFRNVWYNYNYSTTVTWTNINTFACYNLLHNIYLYYDASLT